jgi:hypothetical protein
LKANAKKQDPDPFQNFMVEIVDLLIEQGCPLAIRNMEGVTPLDLIFNHVQNPVAVLQSKAVFPCSSVQDSDL